MTKTKMYIALIVIAAISALAIPMSATFSAATFTVTNTDDSGPGSLRQAILDANAAGTDDVISFDAGVFSSPQTITLTSGQLVAEGNGSLTINGPGANLLTISGNNASRVFNVSGVNTPTAANVTLNNLTITGGNANGGGGIGVNVDNSSSTSTNQGNLTINNVVITNNTTNSGGSGGGINCTNNGQINVNNSLISNNVGNGGGGIYLAGNNSNCFLNLDNSTLDGNNGGAFGGGAIYAASSLNITNSTLSNNTTSRNQSAIRFIGVNNTTCSIKNSTIAGNTTTLAGSTVSIQLGTMILDSVTIANNHTVDPNFPGGLHSFGSSGIQARNTMIANNFNPNGGSDLNVTGTEFQSQGYNLIENIGTSTINGNTTGNIIGVDPILDTELRDNGGPTKTLALLAGSPAIDAGSSFGSATDQRGFTRPVDLAEYPNASGGDASDIGAFEAQTAPTPPSTPNTPLGMNVTVDSPSDDASVTFAEVTAEGETTFTEIDPPTSAGTPPQGFTILGAGPAYDISTSAAYIPPITVCFVVSSINDPAEFERVRILHGEGGVLVDRTILSPDTPAPVFSTRTVCARVSSISPFVAALAPEATPTPTPTPMPTPTPTPVASPTPSPSPEPTPTPTPVPSPSPSPGGGLEGDLASRPNGDGNLLSNDVTLARQFVVGLLIPTEGTNEFQRADTAPLATRGDGILTAGDVTQIRRYVAGIDPTNPAGGPTGSPMRPESDSSNGGGIVEDIYSYFFGREMRVASLDTDEKGRVTVAVEFRPYGDEVAASFTLEYDASLLSNPQIRLSDAAPDGAVLTVNTYEAGKIGILVDSTEAFEASAVPKQFLIVTFDVAKYASGDTAVRLTDSLAHKSTADSNGNTLRVRYLDGVIPLQRE